MLKVVSKGRADVAISCSEPREQSKSSVSVLILETVRLQVIADSASLAPRQGIILALFPVTE
jgi:hypothetical protein